jgi:hypothetical protein
MQSLIERRALTPKELAARWGTKPDAVLRMIHAGKLRAFTLSPDGCKRPRWKIPLDAVVEFENRIEAPPEKPQRKRKKDRPADYIEYF